MPLWIVSTAGSGIATHWNQPPSSSRLTRSAAAPSTCDFHDDRGVRQAEPLGQDDAGLREALVVGLQPGQDEVELLVLHRGRERVGDDERVGARQAVVLDVNGAVGAAGQRFAQHLRDARRPAEQTTTSPPCFSFSRSALFERVGVGLVHLVAGVLLADPGPVVVERAAASRASGTCLMQTAIFMRAWRIALRTGTAARRWCRRSRTSSTARTSIVSGTASRWARSPDRTRDPASRG